MFTTEQFWKPGIVQPFLDRTSFFYLSVYICILKLAFGGKITYYRLQKAYQFTSKFN